MSDLCLCPFFVVVIRDFRGLNVFLFLFLLLFVGNYCLGFSFPDLISRGFWILFCLGCLVVVNECVIASRSGILFSVL